MASDRAIAEQHHLQGACIRSAGLRAFQNMQAFTQGARDTDRLAQALWKSESDIGASCWPCVMLACLPWRTEADRQPLQSCCLTALHRICLVCGGAKPVAAWLTETATG